MSHTWCRLHAASLDNPKIQRLSDRLYKTWGNLLCLTTPTDGYLPPMADVAFRLRLSEAEAEKRIADLLSFGLIDTSDGRLRMHDWDEHQFQSDSSTGRSRKHREKKKQQGGNVPCNGDATLQQRPLDVPATAPDTEQNRDRAETEQSRAERASAPPEENAAALRLIAAFDVAQAAIFAELRRPWPAQSDLSTAKRMLDGGLAEADAKPLFEGLMQRCKASGKAAPKALAYAEGAVAEHVAGLKRGLPVVLPADPYAIPAALDRRPKAVMDPNRLGALAEQAERNRMKAIEEKANG